MKIFALTFFFSLSIGVYAQSPRGTTKLLDSEIIAFDGVFATPHPKLPNGVYNTVRENFHNPRYPERKWSHTIKYNSLGYPITSNWNSDLISGDPREEYVSDSSGNLLAAWKVSNGIREKLVEQTFENGRLTSQLTFTTKTNNVWHAEYVDIGTQSSKSIYSDNEKLYMVNTRWFDKDHRVIKSLDCPDTINPCTVRTYRYNAKGQLVSSLVNYSDGSPLIKNYFRYLTNTKRKKVVLCYENSQLTGKITTLFDEFGNMIKEEKEFPVTEYDRAEGITEKHYMTVWTYNKDQLCTSETEFSGSFEANKIVYEYNSEGLLAKRLEYSQGNLVLDVNIEYKKE